LNTVASTFRRKAGGVPGGFRL